VGYEEKDDLQKTFRFVMGKEQVTRPKTCKTYFDDYGYDDDDDICHFKVCNPEWLQRELFESINTGTL
jgi:hypothetical protein